MHYSRGLIKSKIVSNEPQGRGREIGKKNEKNWICQFGLSQKFGR
jgi:hypothetical protein